MKRTILKTMITTLVLLTGWGSNVWAAVGDVTTNADIDFSNGIVTASSSPKFSIAGATSSMNWDSQWTVTPSVADGMLRIGNFAGKVELVGDAAGSVSIYMI